MQADGAELLVNEFHPGERDDIVQRFWPMIVRASRGYESRPALREELAQDMALEIWRALPRFRGQCTLKTYIYRITHNVAIDHIRRHSRVNESDFEEETLDERSDVEHAHLQAEQQQQLRDAIQRLPLSLRQVLLLKLEDLSNLEVAEVLGLSESNVAVRLNRAKQKLSDLLAGVAK
ncbi:MAG: sigma-70 family RNA polymerase sigma factor [Pseudohongiella sp.]|uniref:RNA polymerase sigma factor n=1 Tax=Pseudohongiella sp. TaxID=1979412 RepID=UPI00349FE4E1